MFNTIINLYALCILAIPMGIVFYGLINLLFNSEYRRRFMESDEYKEIEKEHEELKKEYNEYKKEIKNFFKSN